MRIILPLALGFRATNASLIADDFLDFCVEQLNDLEQRFDIGRRDLPQFEDGGDSANLLVATIASELDFLREMGCEEGSRITKLRREIGQFANQISSDAWAFKEHAPTWFFYSDILKSAIVRAEDVLKHEFVRTNDAKAQALHEEMTAALTRELDQLRHALFGGAMEIFGEEFRELEAEVARLLDAFSTARDTAVHGWHAGAEARRREQEERMRLLAEQDVDAVIGNMTDYARIISKRIEDSEGEGQVRESFAEFIRLIEKDIDGLTVGISKYGLDIEAETQLLSNVVENWSTIRNELEQKGACWMHVLRSLDATEVKLLDTLRSRVDISRIVKLNFEILDESEGALTIHLQERCPSIAAERLHDRVVSLVGYQVTFVLRQVIEQLAAARTHEEVSKVGVFGRSEIVRIASDERILENVMPALEKAVLSRDSSIMAAENGEHELRAKVQNILNQQVTPGMRTQAEQMMKARRPLEQIVTSLHRQLQIPPDWSEEDRKILMTLMSDWVTRLNSQHP